MKKNVAGQVIGAQMVSATDGSAFTSTVSVDVTIDGGTQTSGGGTVTYEGGGFHSYAPTQAETNGTHIAFTFTGVGAIPVTIQVYTSFPQSYDVGAGTINTLDALDTSQDLQHAETQAAIGQISVGSGGLASLSTGATITTGTETNTYTSTQEQDGVYHIVEDVGGNTDFYYEFDVTASGIGTSVDWVGYVQSNGDEVAVQGFNWSASTWSTVRTLNGTNATTPIEESFTVTTGMTGTGVNEGIIRLRFLSTTTTAVATDFLVVKYTGRSTSAVIHTGPVQSATVNSVVLDSAASSVDGAYDPAIILITEGDGAGESREIYQYDGATRTCWVDKDFKQTPTTSSTAVILPSTGRNHTNEGRAQGGTSTTITLNANASASNDTYLGQLAYVKSGNGADQLALITDYNGTTKVATIRGTWPTVNPDTTSVYVIQPQLVFSPEDITGTLNDISVSDILTTQMTESYANDGTAPTIAQALFLIQQQLGDFSISGTTVTVREIDGVTTAATFTLSDGTSPTGSTRSS